MKRTLEYWAAWCALNFLGALPRPLARATGAGVVRLAYALRPHLNRVAMFNLGLAFPGMNEAEKRRIVRRMVRSIGWMAGEFSQFPKFTRANIERVVLLEGFENFDAARKRGKGVLFLTGHMGAWELAPFAQALYGNPLHFLVRPIDHDRVDWMVNTNRCLSGNSPLDKNQSARAMLRILAQGGTVGILMDHNAQLEEGVFADFFGIPACTTSGIARIAWRTQAAVVPGFIHWDENLRKHRLVLHPAIELQRTGDEERDALANTARFNRVLEDHIRKYPEQWLWVHKRWKTRPTGAQPLYPF